MARRFSHSLSRLGIGGAAAAAAAFGLFAVAALPPVPALGQAQTPPPADPAPATATVDATTVPNADAATSTAVPATNPALKAVTDALRANDYWRASILLHAKRPTNLTSGEIRRWNLLSALTALRTGDKEWLSQITHDPAYTSTSDDLVIITAGRLLQDGKYDRARVLLNTVPEPETLSDIPRRRYWENQARLEQMTGNITAERKQIENLVSLVAEWPTAGCQTCHGNPRKYNDDVTTLDLGRVWFLDRYTVLMRQQGDAAKVGNEARATLAKNPNDPAARLRLALSQRALQDDKASETSLRTLSWIEFPDREKKTPLRLATYP